MQAGAGRTAGFPTGTRWGQLQRGWGVPPVYQLAHGGADGSRGGAYRRFSNWLTVGPMAAGAGRTAGFPTGTRWGRWQQGWGVPPVFQLAHDGADGSKGGAYRRFPNRQGRGQLAPGGVRRSWHLTQLLCSGGGAYRRFSNRLTMGPMAAGVGRTAGFPNRQGRGQLAPGGVRRSYAVTVTSPIMPGCIWQK